MLWTWSSLFIRSGLILGAAELLRRIARSSSAAHRHRLLASAFVLLLLWPVFSAMLPEISIGWQSLLPVKEAVTVQQTAFLVVSKGKEVSAATWLAILWGMGALLALTPLIAGHIAVARVAGRTTPLHDPTWQALLDQESARLHLAPSPELLLFPGAVVPFAFGLRRTHIVLPGDCLSWSAARRKAVLIHELAHLARRDLCWRLLANVTTALWWFQPLCWLVRRNLRRESEQACDASVLASGVRPSEYARELLAIAQALVDSARLPAASVVSKDGTDLQARLGAILRSPAQTFPATPAITLATLAVIALAASAVTVSPAQTRNSGGSSMKRTLLSGLLASAGLSAASIGGSVFDPSGAAVANAQATLYNPETSSNQETTTAPDGKFAFPSLPAGSYILHIEKPGFSALYREFNVNQDSEVQRGLMLNIPPAAAKKTAEAQPSNPKLLRVGGEFEQANLIDKVQPVYPPAAKAAHIQGTVKLDVTISKEGEPVDLQVVSSPDDQLTQSALEAVRQWKYRPTLLNGEPVDILTLVVVNYTLTN